MVVGSQSITIHLCSFFLLMLFPHPILSPLLHGLLQYVSSVGCSSFRAHPPALMLQCGDQPHDGPLHRLQRGLAPFLTHSCPQDGSSLAKGHGCAQCWGSGSQLCPAQGNPDHSSQKPSQPCCLQLRKSTQYIIKTKQGTRIDHLSIFLFLKGRRDFSGYV